MMPSELVACPGCGRNVLTAYGQYNPHNGAEGVAGECFMSRMPMPIVGHDEESMEERAAIVAGLARQVQDEDPAAVWKYLTAVPAVFVQELLQVALAGLDVEGKRVKDIWERWAA